MRDPIEEVVSGETMNIDSSSTMTDQDFDCRSSVPKSVGFWRDLDLMSGFRLRRGLQATPECQFHELARVVIKPP